MRVLFITQYFPPESEIGGIRIFEMARHLVARGHVVTVLTGIPNYPSGKVQREYLRKAFRLFWTEDLNGIKVVRVVLYPSHSKRASSRLVNYFSFAIASSLRGLGMRGFDVVVATSPPLTTGIAAWLTASMHRMPLVMEIRDLWPEAAIQLGYLKNSAARKMAYGLERFLYSYASSIVTVSEGIKKGIVRRGIDPNKCSVLVNGIDAILFNPKSNNESIEKLKEDGGIIGLYLGSLSMYHGLDLAVELLKQLQPIKSVKVVFAGGGSAKSELESSVRVKGINNAIFLPSPPRDQMPGLIASADFSLAFVKQSEFSRWLLSSKIFMYMACGSPIFAAAAGETRQIIEEAKAGIVVEPSPNGVKALAREISRVHDDPAFVSFGQNGRVYAEERCSWESIASSYEQILLEAIRKC